MSMVGVLQWSPPSVERDTDIPLTASVPSRLSAIAYAVEPSAEMSVHGSEARSNTVPPSLAFGGTPAAAHVNLGWSAGMLHVRPPSWVTATGSPLEPPLVQRSCCQEATP